MSFMPNRQLILDRICRVCLQYKTDLFFIFDEQFSVDGVKMPQLLTQCTNYSVNAFDSFPHHICGKCVDKAIFVYKFQQQAEKSHQTLTMMFTSVGVNPNVRGRSSMEISTQTDNISIYPCNMCGEKFSDSSDLIEHHLLRHPCKQDDCNVCGDKFTRLCQLRNDIMQIQPKDNSCPLRQTQSTHNQTCESPTISLLSPKADERNNANFKNSLATIQTDFEEYETKVEKTTMFEYDEISIDDNYDNTGVENISTVESMDVTKVTSNENNSGPNAELSPRLLNEIPREASLITEFSYTAYMTSTTKSQSVSSSEISPLKKCANTMTATSLQIGTDLKQKHFSCHLCKRNFFTMEFLNKHLFEIHNQDLECSNEVAEAEELDGELEVEDFKPVLKEINTNTDSNIESLNETEPPDNSLLTIHHNFEPPDVAMENSNELKRPKKEKLFKAELNTINCPRCNRTFAHTTVQHHANANTATKVLVMNWN
ncbi:uncharacterized protein LOC119669875 isoform X2 [Teleopsis dalmanni]|uniref:uncharacterized protein LOC119669875 isoform X2 n=1 Tax=Teleopsis dalmanni TaxID=139649 RepID=UPI0018CEF6CD|nr:uncharacterized protein LOC119669875 isoform X2 [Teleopsis dalmanni]